MEQTTILMEWDGARGQYNYFLCNAPLNPRNLTYNPNINLQMKTQRLSREDAALALGVDERQLA